MSKAKSPAEKIEGVNAQIEKAKEEIRQHQNRLKRLTQTAKAEERNARTHRLIERGAILESVINGVMGGGNDSAAALTNEQVKAVLDVALNTEAGLAKLINLHETEATS